MSEAASADGKTTDELAAEALRRYLARRNLEELGQYAESSRAGWAECSPRLPRRTSGVHRRHKRLPRAACPANKNVLGNLPVPHSSNVPKSLYQSPSGTSGSCDFHSANSNRSFSEICRSLVNLGHASTAQDQCAEFIDHPILLIRIVIGKVFLQPLEEIPLAILLAF